MYGRSHFLRVGSRLAISKVLKGAGCYISDKAGLKHLYIVGWRPRRANHHRAIRKRQEKRIESELFGK